jgi:hypothetical protein
MPVDAPARATLTGEWPRIRRELDAGRLAMVGLIRHHGWSRRDCAIAAESLS